MADQVQEPVQNHKAPADHLLKNVDLGPPQQPQKKTDGNTAFLRAARSGNLEKVLEFINANVDINTSNSNGLNALHLASKDGHVEVAAELLKRGANVDAATKKGNTALHIASLAGQEEVVKLLIEHGASVNLQSQSGFTPLYMAAQENHERVVRYLLNNGANQSLATEDGFTPLAVAMQQGHDKVVTELLENDTRGKIKLPALHIAAKKDDCKAAALLLQSEHNPDITSKSGFTPLHIASHYGNDAIASLLLAKGADVNYAAKHNITPLHVAAKWGRNNMVTLLLDKGASIIAKTRDGLTPLHCAARSGHEQVVDTLLQRHAPITAKTKNGLAPLHMASQGDHVEAARVLLSHRAPVDDVTVDYLTALHVASHCGHVSVAKLLLDRKADPNARALNGFTPLHIACKKNRVKIVELLLKHGGSIEATTESGLSPLHVASFMGCMNIVIYLLQCGANPDVSTIRGETPLHLASRANQTDIIRILLRNGAQVDAKAREQQTPLHIAARLGNTDIVMLLLQHGANVDSVTKDLYTSLHIAAKEDQEEVAQALLENNASMTATTKKGFTPLHLAAKYGRSSIATFLLQRGAPVDAQGKNGVTPLHVASHYDHQGIALLLLDKGASPHATAKNGHTPLHIAAKKNQMDIAAMLLEYGANAGAESKAGFTPLHLSAQEGHVDMTNLLLEHKADVNHSSKNGLTPLHLCAQEDCVDVATILVKNGADVNTLTKAGYTPLHIASHFGQLNMVRFLLSNKAKVDTATSTGYTPLHQAAQQGNSAIVAVLLDNGASPDTKNNQGQTALCIAQKLGYISVVEVLKNVTDNTKAAPVTSAPAGDEKYKVVAPETMQENFMSDSEDEGGEDATNEQSYRYLTIDEMKSLGDDSLPIDTSKEDRYDTTAGHDESISPQHTYNQLSAAPVIDNVDVTRAPVIQTGFLVSFLVDAKGGAMRGCRHSGVRVIVPPQCVTMPTRVTCRYIRRDKPNHPPPPPLMESEALASRILELGPVGVKFLGPVVIEVPNFAALRGNEREIVILRSDNGETWREHTVDSSSEAVHDILSRSFDKDGNQVQSDEPNRITSIVTHDFPHYFAIVSRIRQEVHAIGPEGGMVSSSVVPQVQAVFPQGALTKKIKVGLQAQPIPSELTAAVLGNCVAVSPIVTIEPRRRKFHKPITLTLPVPQAANKGMINQYSGDAPTLRLLCSITGGTSRAQWEDVTGSTPLTFVKECVSFTTTVSARFWLMDIRDIAVATKKATELYREAIHIPFMAKFVVFAKRIDNNEARLRVFCMTDDKEDKTLESQEHFTEVAKSRDVEVLEGKKQLIELSGNLISVTKSGDQLKLGFNAFQENRLPFTIRIKDSLADPIGRMLFFKEQKPVKTSTPHPPICVLNIVLPDTIIPDSEFANSPIRKYNLLNDSQGYHRSELKFSDISNLIGEDWEALAEKLGIRSSECKVIKIENPEGTARQSSVMLKQWNQRAGTKATANILESALLSIGREDIVQECFLNTNQKNKLPSENGLITHKTDDIRGSKKDLYSTDDDERKYTAEEKIIDETELKSVSERKQEIEKRLLDEQINKKENLKERSDSEEKKQLSSKQSSEDREIIKNVVHDDKESFEPTKMTFQQKRLSFEKGYSVDKILSEGIVVGETAQTVAKDEDKVEVKEKPAEKAPSVDKVPQKEPSPPKQTEQPLKKDKSVDKVQEAKSVPSKIPVQKNKSDEKVAQKSDQREKTPEDKKPVQKGKSVEKSASKDKVDKVVEKSPDKADKPLEKSASKDKVDKSLQKSASKDKVDKPLEKSASKDKVDKPIEKSASKDKVDKPLEKSASKDKVDKSLEKSFSKDKVDKSLEKSASKDKVDKSLEKSSSKDKVDKSLEKSSSKDKVDKSLEKSLSKDKVDKPLEKSSSKDKVDKSLEKSPSSDKVTKPIEKSPSKDKMVEKVPSIVEKYIVEEKIEPTQTSKSPENQLSEEKSPPKDTKTESSTFQEKHSFDHGDGTEPSKTVILQTTVTSETKLPNDGTKPTETKSVVTTTTTTTTVEKRSDTDARRDSELFEGVSLGLGKLEAKPIPPEQNFLSPKPLMTPPPSPAEFKEGTEEWHKTDSLDSNRSNKSVTDIETPSETQTVTPTEYTEQIASRITSNQLPTVLNNLSEDIEKLPVPDYNFESIAAESVCELEAPVSSRVQIVSETSPTPQPVQQPHKYTDEMIDKLIEQERAKLIASGIKFDSDTDEEQEMETESSKRNGRSSRLDLSSDEDNESDADLGRYLKTSEIDDHASDHSDRSPQRKVAFRLNSDENQLVYPGQTDSEENTSTSDNSDDSVANEDIIQVAPVPDNVLKTPPNEVERKFERMASETEDDVGKVEGEFHRIVSQLSFEEVTDCLNAWNETESSTKHDLGDKSKTVPGRPEGNKQLSTESDTVDKDESMDYVSRKKFWQSFESASVDKGAGAASAAAPVPKPRASICTTGVTIDEAPIASKRSTDNIRSGFVASKSESMQERFSSDIDRFHKPSMKKVHSLTSYSTDSEAEYIANCGVEKLAYENVAFCEEDESICEVLPEPVVETGVRAKKMLFEKMQSNSSQESITSPTSKSDEIGGIVKTSIVTAEKLVKKDSSLDSVSKKEDHVGLVKSATASIEKRIEQPVKRDSSQESVTSPIAGIVKTSIATTESRIKRDSSQDSVSSTSSKKDEGLGLVKSATASIEKRIEQPVKRDSSQESVSSPTAGIVKTSIVATESRIKKDSSQDSVSSTSSKKDEGLGLVKSATASIEKRIEQPVKKDSSQESVTSPTSKKEESAKGIVKNAAKIIEQSSIEKKIEQPVKKEPSQESITTQSSKGLVKSAASSIEQIIKQESSQENMTSSPAKKETVEETKTTVVSTQQSLEQPASQVSVSSKKDEPAVIISKIEKTTEIISKKGESDLTTCETKETASSCTKQEPLSTIDKKEEIVTTTVEKKEPVVTIHKKEELEITTKQEPVATTKVIETVVTTSTESKKEHAVTKKSQESTVISSTEEKVIKIISSQEEKSVESIEKHLEQSLAKESSSESVLIDKFTEQPLKKDVSLEKVALKVGAIDLPISVTTTVTSLEQPLTKDPSRDSIASDQIAKSTSAVITTATTVTTSEIHSKPSIDKDSSIEKVAKRGDSSEVIKTTPTPAGTFVEQSICKNSSLDNVKSLSLEKYDPVGSISVKSPCRDSSQDSSSPSSKKDRPIDATESLKLDIKSPSSVESKPNGSLDESIDNTQSESDITPEDLRDGQFIMQDWESTSELLENLVQDRTIPMAQSSSIIVQDIQDITQQQIRFNESEEYKHYNNIRTVSEDDSECEALKEEAKAAAENLINEIEEELGRRPDIVECLLKSKIDELVEEIATSSNDITDEDLKSTGTEIDIPMPYGFDDSALLKMKISQASPTEYEIKFEQVEEFNVLESVDFEEPIIQEDVETSLRSGSESYATIGKKEIAKPSRIPVKSCAKSSTESKSSTVQRKTSDEDKSRTSTSPEYVQDFIEIRQSKHRKSGADFEPCSSSSESHYHSFEHSGTTSRPLSSDVEGLLSGGGVPGTTGSSEYETAASHDTSHDFHTAMSSASLHESIKSIDSESSGNLGSAEVSSEVSETLVASSAELDHDIDLPPSHYYDDTVKRSAYRSSPVEPYDREIPMEVIKGASQSFDMSHLEPFASSHKKLVESVSHPHPHSSKSKEDSHEFDDKLLSSSEDVSMFSLTDGGGNLQTVIEVNSTNESDKMDNSIISEQSLTISATSNLLSSSSSADLKDEVEPDKKLADSNSVQSVPEPVTKSCSNTSITCAQLSTNKIDKSDSKDTICRDISIDDIPNISIQQSTPPQHTLISDPLPDPPSKDPSISPDSESFELIEQPDMMDDFVIIEEVAKEAFEQDPEGKSIKITGKRQIPIGYDDEIVIPPKTSSVLTRVEYYGGADGCGFPIEGVSETVSKAGDESDDIHEHEVEEGKKWIEMQFQADSEDASGYEYNYERGPLEDIKEEDTDDMQSSKMGSVGSQISQSIGSLGSMKQSLSSTPDYDILAGKRYFANKSSDKDDVSQGSLQEFERLEQLMTLESVKNKLSGSQDSLGSSNSTNGGSKKRNVTGDDVSVSSLNEFEGLEHACVEAEKIKERARVEEHLLSQIEEGHESQASESESCETLEKSCYDESDNDEDYDQKMFEIDEIIRQAQSNVEKFIDVDQLERTESLGRGDSFEETARIPDFELDQPLTENTHSSSDIYSGKKYIEHFDLSHSLTTSTDSLEPKCKPEDILVTSTDSLEGGPTTATTSKSKSTVISDSLDATDNRVESPRSAYDADEEHVGPGDDFDVRRLSPHHLMLSSPDSLDATSSAATHATYHNETDSAMSSSFTSAGSNTMISSTENLENIVTNYSNWLDSNPYMTEVVYNVTEKSYVTTERVAESSHQQRTSSSQGQDAKKLYEKDMAAFKPGEYYTETREVDSEGNVHIKKIVESRAVVTSEKMQNSEKIILDPEQYRGRETDTDFTTVSSSSSHFVTTTTTTESSSGTKTETSVRIEKKEVPGKASSVKLITLDKLPEYLRDTVDWFIGKARRRDKELCADEPKFYLEESVLENKLPEITFRSLIELPSGLDYNEWLASHTIAIFDNVNLMYGTISEFCTATGCPDMVGPGFRTYLWFDDKGKKTRVSAPQYVDYVMTFTQKTINDEGVFPTKYPHEFPSSFETIVRKILRLLFHVLAHLYHSHFREMVMLNLHSHLNSVFTHLIILNDCYHLIDDRELEILFDLVHALKILENDATATKSLETSQSSVTNGCLSSDNSADKQVEASANTSGSTKSSEQLASFSDPNSMLPATGNVANDATSATEVVNFSC